MFSECQPPNHSSTFHFLLAPGIVQLGSGEGDSGSSRLNIIQLAKIHLDASRFLAESQSRVNALRDRRFLYPGNESAPLFFSIADFPADDRAHDEEVSDYYALKKSRRNFEGYDSPGNPKDHGSGSVLKNSLPDGIRSSWKPESPASSQGPSSFTSNANSGPVVGGERAMSESDVGEHSTKHLLSGDSVEQIGKHREEDEHVHSAARNNFDPDRSSSTNETHHTPPTTPLHDMIWAKVYAISLSFLAATSFMVWIRTDVPGAGKIGDTIYSVLHNAFPLFALDTLLAVLISVVYLALLRLFVKPLVYFLVVSVPAATAGVGMYSLSVSYRGGWEDNQVQATALRWASVFPAVLAIAWVYSLYRGRKALGGAVKVTELACKILNHHPALMVFSFAILVVSAGLTWAWIGMFSRVFLNGQPTFSNGKPGWVIYPRSWPLGAYFVVMYLWTLGIIHGILRATVAATVSHWYFYRHETPKSSSNVVVGAAIRHATTSTLGTVCYSTFLSLLIRLPVLVLRGRFGSISRLLCFNLIASPITSLSAPLSLSYAAIHSVPLVPASGQVHALYHQRIGNHTRPITGPGSPYYLSKMCLSAIRGVTALFLGLLAWVRAARDLNGGSLYGYVVGMSAAAIGWAVLGASEGTLGNIVDSCLLCVLSEGQEARYCHEARDAFVEP